MPVMEHDGRTSITVDAVSKRYGPTAALRSVTLAVGRGEIFGVLGPNGAGKTTLIETIEGLRQPDAGTVRVLGVDPLRAGAAFRAQVSIKMQGAAVSPLVTVGEVVRLYGSIYGDPRSVEAILVEARLGEKGKARVNTLSGGQLQRLTIALALVGDPAVVLMDEPTSELDPQARRAAWAAIANRRARRGTTFVLTTHNMDEAQRLCDRVAIIDAGSVVRIGTPGELMLGGPAPSASLEDAYLQLTGLEVRS